MSKDGSEIDDVKETKCINYAVDLYLGTEYRPGVVERALNWRKKASPEAQKALRAAITNSNFSVQGFRSTSAYNAPSGLLLNQVVERMPESNDLSGAILRVWVESQEALHAHVVEHRKKADLPIQEYVSGREFPGLWDFDEWNHEIDVFVKENGKHCEDDVALMLCCVSGNMPLPPPDDPGRWDCPTGRQHICGLDRVPESSYLHMLLYGKKTEDFINPNSGKSASRKSGKPKQALAAALAKAARVYVRRELPGRPEVPGSRDFNAWSEVDACKLGRRVRIRHWRSLTSWVRSLLRVLSGFDSRRLPGARKTSDSRSVLSSSRGSCP